MADDDIKPPGVELIDPEDFPTWRRRIYDGVKEEMTSVFPQSYGGVRMELHDVDYSDPDEYSLHEQKKALLEDKYLARRLRGTVKLFNEADGTLLEEKPMTLLRVPYLTQRGTIIHGGNEYAAARQSRLLPGIYTRKQDNGHLEAQINAKKGTGVDFRINFEPDTAQYRLKVQSANLHLYSLLKDLGIPDDHLATSWGQEVLEANKAKYDARVFNKAYDRLVPKRLRNPEADQAEKAQAIKDALEATKVTKRVVQHTLPNAFDLTKSAEWRARAIGRELFEKRAAAIPFEPDLKPEDMRDVYNALYAGVGPRLASMEKWPSKWFAEGSDPLGWVEWYFKYCDGRKHDDDARQIARWKSFKARHGALFKKNPTPRRAFALRAWAIDPLKLLPEDQREEFSKLMEAYKSEKESEHQIKKAGADIGFLPCPKCGADDMHGGPKDGYDQGIRFRGNCVCWSCGHTMSGIHHRKSASSVDKADLQLIAEFLNNEHQAGIDLNLPSEALASAIEQFLRGTGGLNPELLQAGLQGADAYKQASVYAPEEVVHEAGLLVLEKLARYGAGILFKQPNGKYLLQEEVADKWNPPEIVGKIRPAGGGKSKGDANLKQTILREIEEEFGLDPEKAKDKIRLLGYIRGGKFADCAMFEMVDHGLKPGVYQASNSKNEKIKLVEADLDDPRYIGKKPEQLRRYAKKGYRGADSKQHWEPWYGVDLDATLAKHGEGEFDPYVIGEPIPKMVRRVKDWLEQGKTVKIFTARAVAEPKCIPFIQAWTEEHLGQKLEVTSVKDPGMVALYDDRARQVEANTGDVVKSASELVWTCPHCAAELDDNCIWLNSSEIQHEKCGGVIATPTTEDEDEKKRQRSLLAASTVAGIGGAGLLYATRNPYGNLGKESPGVEKFLTSANAFPDEWEPSFQAKPFLNDYLVHGSAAMRAKYYDTDVVDYVKKLRQGIAQVDPASKWGWKDQKVPVPKAIADFIDPSDPVNRKYLQLDNKGRISMAEDSALHYIAFRSGPIPGYLQLWNENGGDVSGLNQRIQKWKATLANPEDSNVTDNFYFGFDDYLAKTDPKFHAVKQEMDDSVSRHARSAAKVYASLGKFARGAITTFPRTVGWSLAAAGAGGLGMWMWDRWKKNRAKKKPDDDSEDVVHAPEVIQNDLTGEIKMASTLRGADIYNTLVSDGTDLKPIVEALAKREEFRDVPYPGFVVRMGLRSKLRNWKPESNSEIKKQINEYQPKDQLIRMLSANADAFDIK